MSQREDRIRALKKLGQYFRNISEKDPLYNNFFKSIDLAGQQNGWFEKKSCLHAFTSWGDALKTDKIEKWISQYDLEENLNPKTIALIPAGNIPLVGLHDLICIWISGNISLVKCSTKDSVLIPYIVSIDPLFQSLTSLADGQLEDFDAIIATGSNNAARYFEYYFSKYPHIIRKNRNGIAVLDGSEAPEQFEGLGKDILQYYGLGCRNVSKLYLPLGFDLNLIFGGLYPHADVIEMNKYANNYDYNKAVYLMSDIDFMENGFFMLREDKAICSPIATCHYEFYDTLDLLKIHLKERQKNIQCIVSKTDIDESISFGQAQFPQLWDYADGVDTLKFIQSL